jgi:hypothetical protein
VVVSGADPFSRGSRGQRVLRGGRVGTCCCWHQLACWRACVEVWWAGLPPPVLPVCLASLAPLPSPPPSLPAGDYWPGEAENLLASMASEAAGGGGKGGKGKASGGRSKASLKGKARAGPASGSTTEELLRRLGDTIQVQGWLCGGERRVA